MRRSSRRCFRTLVSWTSAGGSPPSQTSPSGASGARIVRCAVSLHSKPSSGARTNCTRRRWTAVGSSSLPCSSPGATGSPWARPKPGSSTGSKAIRRKPTSECKVTKSQARPGVGAPAQGVSSGQSLSAMENSAKKTLPGDIGYQWSTMSYQEKLTGNQLYYLVGLSVLLVYLCLAGQYDSWIRPLAVLSAVPLALLGPVIALTSLGVPNNLYTQIGLILMIVLSAKNGILIVEMAREGRLVHGKSIREAAVEASRSRFRPILMTSFAFGLAVVPLVLATGAGANGQKSLGLSVLSGIIASTCLAVLFVPSFFVVLQGFEEWRKARKKAPVAAPRAAE